MLAHRLGLVPLQGNKDGLKWLRWFKRATEDDPQSDMPSDYNTIILNLDVECTWQDGGMERYKKGETDPKKLYHNSSGELASFSRRLQISSKHLKFIHLHRSRYH